MVTNKQSIFTFCVERLFINKWIFLCRGDLFFKEYRTMIEKIIAALSALGSGVLKVLWLPVEIMEDKLKIK